MFRWILTGMGISVTCAAVFWIIKSFPKRPDWAEWLLLCLAIFVIVACELTMLGALWF